MNPVIFVIGTLAFFIASIYVGFFVRGESIVGVLISSIVVVFSFAAIIGFVNFEEPNPYTPATVLAHNGSTTIFQEVDSDKVHIIDKYYEDDNQYLLDIVDDEIIVVWSADEGSLG